MPRKLIASLFTSVDDVVLDRVTYQEWSGYFPTSDDPFADFINPVRKHVASRTLAAGDLAWDNARLVEGDLLDHVRDLKQGEGRDVSVCGSISVVGQLVAAGLVDELAVVVHPVVAGRGRHLGDEVPMTRLALLDVQRTEKGNAILTYGPRSDR